VSSDAEFCRAKAAECGERAKSALSQEARTLFHNLQQKWISAAERIEAGSLGGSSGLRLPISNC